MNNKPQLSFWHIWNMCFGFLGIQFGFALQNANMSRIFQTLGADVHDIAGLWVAAPLTGLLVQPLVGYYSDRCRSRFGRRRPFFVVGAVLTTIALLFMPNASYLWMAAGMLWVLDASINITMEPFRAFVGDMLPKKQRAFGYAMQSFFIGIGAVIASALPWILNTYFDVANTAESGVVPASVRYAFYWGAAVLFVSVMWTVVSSREYSDEELKRFHGDSGNETRNQMFGANWAYWILSGFVFLLCIAMLAWQRELYIIAIGAMAYGCLLYLSRQMQATGQHQRALFQIIYDLNTMPGKMRQLSLVQFFSWFALFSMWIYATPAVTEHFFHSSDASSEAYNKGADWVGVLFASYNGFAAIAAIAIAALSRWKGAKFTHALCLFIGALGFFSFVFLPDAHLLIISMFAVGVAWASILSMPYAMLANVIPQNKMGLYMGIFNFFIVIPQLLAASVLGALVKFLFGGSAIYAFVLAAVFWLAAAILTLRIESE
ncbi:MFS transporter [Agaribacterium haliotis]|uniref:MFS transporter n=1 Tax=Agaribacterium haliotis TaxID=2013869 RepID=UPI000BB57EB8|nr:MFS transporter [Agaribacterium haliotis]